MKGDAWNAAQTAYIKRHYATAHVADMMVELAKLGPPRGIDAIHGKARYLRLLRETDDRRKSPPIVTLKSKILAMFAEHFEQTVNKMHASTGSKKSSCWRVCEELQNTKVIHVSRWECKNGNFEAIYHFGPGANVPRPYNKIPKGDIYKPQPIPYATLGVWHSHIFNQSRLYGGERNIAP